MKKTTLFLTLLGATCFFSRAQSSGGVNTKLHKSYQMTIHSFEKQAFQPTLAIMHDIRGIIWRYNFPDTTNITDEVVVTLDLLTKQIKQFDSCFGTFPIPVTISIIGQTHRGGLNFDQSYQSELLESQMMVKDILLYNKYHIVGVEGATNKNWDPQLGVKNFNIGHRTRYGITLHNRMIGSYETIPPTKKEFENRSYEYCVPEYNLLPGTQFIGIEDTTLYYFNSITLGTGSRSCSEYFCINQLVVSLRSHIAFYKIIQSALEQKTSHVAIVIGSAHMRDFMSLAKNYGVQTHFYNTSRTSFWKLILQE